MTTFTPQRFFPDGMGGVGIEPQPGLPIPGLENMAVQTHLSFFIKLTDNKLMQGPENAGFTPLVETEDGGLKTTVTVASIPDSWLDRAIEVITG